MVCVASFYVLLKSRATAQYAVLLLLTACCHGYVQMYVPNSSFIFHSYNLIFSLNWECFPSWCVIKGLNKYNQYFHKLKAVCSKNIPNILNMYEHSFVSLVISSVIVCYTALLRASV